MLGKLRGIASPKPASSPAKSAGSALSGLAAVLNRGITLQPDRVAALKDGFTKGLEFFEAFNDSRLKLAFGSFDEDMKKALYDVLFLLHVNDPAMAEFKFTGIKRERQRGVVKDLPFEATANLYVEGAPHGVQGIDQLSPVFRAPFEAYVRETFQMPVAPVSTYGWNPVVSIHSLGSIGTIGHKSKASDLDLQIQYELEPFLVDVRAWNDAAFRDALVKEQELLIDRARQSQSLSSAALQDPKLKEGLTAKANGALAKTYPLLTRYLFGGDNAAQELLTSNEPGLHAKLVHELMLLVKRASRIALGDELKKRDALMKQRITAIQNYLFTKWPNVEIYLFSASNDDYRRGYHGTTLESKEASGSAYQLILNYETLMPGIQLTPMVPTHFVLPQIMNDDAGRYDRIVDYIRFNAIDVYAPIRERLVNLGAVPDMPLAYVAGHGGAVYWEAFKASSGNLPKATLNLLRIEMLLDQKLLKTIIQLIKDPTYVNALASPKPADERKDIEAMVNNETGIPPWALLEIEQRFPLLLQDPWWLRYKALKIGFSESNGVSGPSPEERKRISKVIDLAFALHVRVSDVFTKPGDTRPFDSHREKVLIEFLRRAFPPVSPKRTFLEHLFIGGVHAVNEFERELRDVFKATLNRVNQKVAAIGTQGEGNQKEFEIWYHFYQQNFEPAPNVIQRTIMNHLKVPRGRVRVGYRLGKGWFFNSVQRESGVGKRFDTFGYLDHLPDEVELIENTGFLAGLAHCIINGYYGIVNKGTLKESLTVLEFDPKAMDLGNRVDNQMAFVRPDQVQRILYQVLDFFPYQPYHYMDCIRLKRQVSEVLVFLSLLKYGRLSVLYRDNLRTWYCDEFEHPDVFRLAQRLHQSVRETLMAKPFHVTLARFFKSKGIELDKVALAAWVNPNSIETTHSSAQVPQKEKELAAEFLGIIKKVHGPKVSPGQPPGTPESATGAPATGEGEVPAGASGTTG
jgi:hypothetical protein